MTEVGKAYVTLLPSARGFASAMQRELSGDIARAGRQGGEDYGEQFSREARAEVSSKGRSIFGPLARAAALVGGGAAIGKLFADSISAASDLGEVTSKASVIFGKDMVPALERFADKAASTMGQSRTQALDAAATFAIFGKSAGLTGEELVKFSTGFTGLASDLASFNNTSPQEAIEAIGAALRGETEPIRAYGVMIDDASMRQEALRLGLIKTTKDALKPQQKALAAQALIYKQTEDAQGDFARTSDGLANQQRILAAQFEDVKVSIGEALLPVVTDLVSWVGDKVVPKLQDWADWLAENKDEIQDTARALANDLMPPLKTLVEIVANAIEWVVDLPDPVKDFGAQAAIAALLLPKLSTAITGVAASAASMATNLTTAQARMAMFARGAKNAAGIGGVIALTQGVNKADSAMGALMLTAGGAAAGFAVGGPLGAAVGGAGGYIFALTQKLRRQAETFTDAAPAVENYAETLDNVTGATTRATNALILEGAQKAGVMDLTARLGINARDLIGAVKGQDAATRRLNRAFSENARLLGGDEQAEFREWLRVNTSGLADQRQQFLENKKALTPWKAALKGLPKEVQTRVKQIGANISREELRKLKRQYDLNPKQVQTIVEAVGTESTIKRVKGVVKAFQGTQEIEADLHPWLSSFNKQVDQGKDLASRGSSDLGRLLKVGVSEARPDLRVFSIQFEQYLDNLRGSASTGGHQIGSDLGSGLNSGISAWVGPIAATAAGAVREAENAARAEADARSPSRKTQRLGEDLMEGLVLGITAGAGRVSSVMETALGLASTPVTRVAGPRPQPRPVAPAVRTAGQGAVGMLTITNWREGTGYFRIVAEESLAADQRFHRDLGAMHA